MEPQCVDVERIGEIMDLPADHPDRRHAEACPRCRTLVESYLAFVKAEPSEGSEIERARGVLDDRIREDAERWIPSETKTSRLSSRSWLRALLRPAPLFAAASVVIAGVFLWTLRAPEEPVLRDDASAAQGLALHAAELLPDGGIRLSWSPMRGADAYQARVYGPDLNEVYRSAETAQTWVVLARSELPTDLPASLDLTWRVYALAGGDVIDVSAPGSVRAP